MWDCVAYNTHWTSNIYVENLSLKTGKNRLLGRPSAGWVYNVRLRIRIDKWRLAFQNTLFILFHWISVQKLYYVVAVQKLMGNLPVQVYIIINLYGLKGKRFAFMYNVRTFLLQVVIPWTVGKPLLTSSDSKVEQTGSCLN